MKRIFTFLFLLGTVFSYAGDGTEGNPYTIAEAVALELGDTEFWAQGYIVGARYTEFEAPFTNDYSIVMADTDTENDVTKCLQLKLESDGGRTTWGLNSVPENKGKLIKFKGYKDTYGGYPSFEGVNNEDISEVVADNVLKVGSLSVDKVVPTAAEALEITCEITGGTAPYVAAIGYKEDGVQNLTPVVMTSTDGITYKGSIPAKTDGTLIEYGVAVQDAAAGTANSNPAMVLWGTTPIATVLTMDADNALMYKNAYARITGVATVAANTFSASNLDVYLQDATGGINLFSFDANNAIVVGNSYTAIGEIDQYNGKSEIVPASDADVTDNGAGTAVVPMEVTMAALLADPEAYEGELVKILDVDTMPVMVNWPTEGNNENLTTTDDDGTTVLTIRIDKDTDIDGTEAPELPADVTGIFSQYDSSSPYDSGYQLFPRFRTDFVSVATEVETIVNKALSIYSYGRTLVVNSDIVTHATVYNLAGQVVREMNIEAGRNEFSMNRVGIYLVRVNSNIQKVVIR